MSSVREVIVSSLSSTVDEMGGNLTQELTDNTVLLQSGLDSLGFAVLVSRLEDELGYDPFSLVDDPFYPATLGEFVSFYEQNKPL
jgi:acyl carrier protein